MSIPPSPSCSFVHNNGLGRPVGAMHGAKSALGGSRRAAAVAGTWRGHLAGCRLRHSKRLQLLERLPDLQPCCASSAASSGQPSSNSDGLSQEQPAQQAASSAEISSDQDVQQVGQPRRWHAGNPGCHHCAPHAASSRQHVACMHETVPALVHLPDALQQVMLVCTFSINLAPDPTNHPAHGAGRRRCTLQPGSTGSGPQNTLGHGKNSAGGRSRISDCRWDNAISCMSLCHSPLRRTHKLNPVVHHAPPGHVSMDFCLLCAGAGDRAIAASAGR